MAKGSIQNKDSFLNHIAEQLGRERNTDVPLPEWEYQPQWDVYQDKTADELCGLFKKNSEEKDTHVLETTKQQLPEMMEHVMETYGGAPMVSTDDERFGTYGLTDVLAKNGVHQWDPEQGKENIENAKAANIGFLFSDVSLAESGTITQF